MNITDISDMIDVTNTENDSITNTISHTNSNIISNTISHTNMNSSNLIKNLKKNKIAKSNININIDINKINDNLTNDELNHEIELKNELVEEHKKIMKKIKNFEIRTNKEIIEIYSDMKKFEKNLIKNETKNNKKNIKNNDWGISEKKDIPIKIVEFFNIEPNSKLSRTIIGGLFQNYLKNNNLKGNINLKNKLDNRIYKMDDKLIELFGLTQQDKEKINNSNSSKTNYPDGFNFYNYQTWIKKIYNE